MTTDNVSPEIAEELRLEDRAHKIRQAVLSDSKFMEGVRQAQKESQNGGRGRSWAEVTKEIDEL